MIHDISEGEIEAIVQSAVILSHTRELETTDLADTDTNTDTDTDTDTDTETNTDPTHPSLLHSPLEDTLVAPEKPPPCTHIEDGDAAIQARAGYLLDVCLLGAKTILFEV